MSGRYHQACCFLDLFSSLLRFPESCKTTSVLSLECLLTCITAYSTHVKSLTDVDISLHLLLYTSGWHLACLKDGLNIFDMSFKNHPRSCYSQGVCSFQPGVPKRGSDEWDNFLGNSIQDDLSNVCTLGIAWDTFRG